VGEINALFTQQQVDFYKKLKIINDLCKNSDSLTYQIYELRTYYEDISNKISKFITWQDNIEGMNENILKI